ncbi:hypothetical protein M409DRAFT_20385 [Zasmidium cellare ATCC 36951]|uniref:Uncharacterized protein n=1 Tax=Zasmidium cellare ATCC 36951 TaxID=1080233 RepID=A0A6A6CQ15_ZASCE|nr:uncharacterized protein M409DRAFT_20385 [Zasmidium cellare ATCC 36951]KAF2169161.1 hypothetical protein M409DRAFT_20385 [Zasmidium cellare ATCC 36951]
MRPRPPTIHPPPYFKSTSTPSPRMVQVSSNMTSPTSPTRSVHHCIRKYDPSSEAYSSHYDSDDIQAANILMSMRHADQTSAGNYAQHSHCKCTPSTVNESSDEQSVFTRSFSCSTAVSSNLATPTPQAATKRKAPPKKNAKAASNTKKGKTTAKENKTRRQKERRGEKKAGVYGSTRLRANMNSRKYSLEDDKFIRRCYTEYAARTNGGRIPPKELVELYNNQFPEKERGQSGLSTYIQRSKQLRAIRNGFKIVKR